MDVELRTVSFGAMQSLTPSQWYSFYFPYYRPTKTVMENGASPQPAADAVDPAAPTSPHVMPQVADPVQPAPQKNERIMRESRNLDWIARDFRIRLERLERQKKTINLLRITIQSKTDVVDLLVSPIMSF